jgi:hypothetical protein
MADGFRADPAVASQVAGELAGIRDTMQSMDNLVGGYEGALQSGRVEKALHDFSADSSDYREAMSGLLDRASKLLQGLADGTHAVDSDLTASLTEASQ